ncbi:kinase-like domain-containing protein [Phialemonium atrogriseum]|uniref:Kinase-like domain-containing protein n=1 Tax=Phialemonium atrogriseum TaxID=1093897 RepID=A0AAJ0FJR9_9PEZI|nr:kinase-like domain-containing protein [Phialemonium atrogriseum]KAK1763380.1 kinase-like domain-containing protein [Phialemonium atrogriseum]
MAPLDQPKNDELSSRVLQHLSHTRYACSSLTRLSSGTTNFVFRGILAQPFLRYQDGMTALAAHTIIVKHSTDYVAVNRDCPLDVSRCFFEEYMLNSLQNSSSTSTSVKTPRPFLFDRETNAQVLEDVPDSVDLKSILVSPEANHLLIRPLATCIGRDMGTWLRSFHDQCLAPAQADLRAEIGRNEPMRLKYLITYHRFIEVLENFPKVLEGCRKTLEDGKGMAAREFEIWATEPDEGRGDWGVIHGDFWSGNVLVRNPKSETQQPEGTNELFIIDWEFAQFGHRAYDLGQMIGDLYERKHFNDVDSAMWAMQGFIDGRPVHAGVHLTGWYTRRAPNDSLTGTPEQIVGAMELGRDFIVKGWEKDKNWVEHSVLAPLFKES